MSPGEGAPRAASSSRASHHSSHASASSSSASALKLPSRVAHAMSVKERWKASIDQIDMDCESGAECMMRHCSVTSMSRHLGLRS